VVTARQSRAAARAAAFWWQFVVLTALSICFGYHAFRHSTLGWVLTFRRRDRHPALRDLPRPRNLGRVRRRRLRRPDRALPKRGLGNLGTAFALAAVGIGLVALGAAARRYGGAWPRRPAPV
jgi:hypothetical protein